MLAAAIAGQSLGACAKTTENPEMRPVDQPLAGASAGSAGFAGAPLAGHGGGGGSRDIGFMAPPYGLSPPPPDAGNPNPPDSGKQNPRDDDAGEEDAGTE
jgi:hypothetical protein